MQYEDKVLFIGSIMTLSLIIYVIFANFTVQQPPLKEIQINNNYTIPLKEIENNKTVPPIVNIRPDYPKIQFRQEFHLTNGIKKTPTFTTQQIPLDKTVNQNDSKNVLLNRSDNINEICISTNKESDYTVKLISNKTLQYEKEPDIVQYILVNGIINANNISSSFTLSVDENYKNDININLMLIITSLKDNKAYTCDAYFLKDLNVEYIYDLTVDLYKNSANCYISSNQKLPTFGDELTKQLSLK